MLRLASDAEQLGGLLEAAEGCSGFLTGADLQFPLMQHRAVTQGICVCRTQAFRTGSSWCRLLWMLKAVMSMSPVPSMVWPAYTKS